MNNPLTDVLPPQARKYVYALLALGAVVLAAYTAADGDWLKFAGLVLGALGFGTASSNTPAPDGGEEGVITLSDVLTLALVVLVVVVVLVLVGVI